MANELLLKNYLASGAISAHLIVKTTTTDYTYSVAAAATDALAGVNAELDIADGERGDAVKVGIADVIYGGTVAAGDPLTSDSAGKAVKAAPSAGTNARIIGFAQVKGVSGDLGSVLLAPGEMQG